MNERKTLDENDKLQQGTLPKDPAEGTKPLRLVSDDECSDIVAEQAAVASLLWAGLHNPTSLRVGAISDILVDGSKEFAEKRHGIVYDAMIACHAATPVQEHDVVAVHAQIVSLGKDKAVPIGWIRDLLATQNAAMAITRDEHQLRHYASLVHDQYIKRRAISSFGSLSRDASDKKVSPTVLLERMVEGVKWLSERVVVGADVVSAKQSATEFFKALQHNLAVGVDVFSTGFPDVDAMLNGGLRPDEVGILAARTSVGKSTLGAQFGEHVASNPKYGVLYVTLEMPHKSFTARLIAARAGIELSELRRAGTPLDKPRGSEALKKFWLDIGNASNAVSETGLFSADCPTQTIQSVYAMARRLSRALQRAGKSLALVVIDHVGLIKPPEDLIKRKATREQQVADTSRTLRMIAQELHCHVLGLVQVHRDAEKQRNEFAMPKLHQLRESGALEQDPDVVLVLHRPRDPATGQFHKGEDYPAVIALAKGRMDETGVKLLSFDGSHSRFANFVDLNGRDTYEQFYGKDA